MLAKIRTLFAIALMASLTPAAAVDPMTSHWLEVEAPSLVVLETTAPDPHLALRTADVEDAERPIVLEASPSHLVLAIAKPGSYLVDGPADGELVATVTRAEIREQELRLEDVAYAVATSFYPAGIDTKEEDHEIDPDPKSAGPLATKEEDHEIDPDPNVTAERPLVTLITVAETLFLKEEDHEIDPDPKSAGAETLLLKEEDHGRPLGGTEGGRDRDPDPKSAWVSDWALTSAAVRTLGPGWYFVVRAGGKVSYEVLIEARK